MHPQADGYVYSLSNVTVHAGGTLTIGVEANPGWFFGRLCASVTIHDSIVVGNGVDIYNTLSDVPGGCSVDAARSTAGNISSHEHTCVLPEFPTYSIRIWDVKGIFRDGSCTSPYKEVKPHP